MSEDKEIAAMSAIAKALDGFADQEAEVRERILQWACARYRVQPRPASRKESVKDLNNESNDGTTSTAFATFADLYHAADPDTDIDRALIAGYWLGQGDSRSEFTGMDANKELKNLGHPVGNITDALQTLIDKRPALVMQTAKSGSTKQARKKYRLTHAGVTAVIEMTRSEE